MVMCIIFVFLINFVVVFYLITVILFSFLLVFRRFIGIIAIIFIVRCPMPTFFNHFIIYVCFLFHPFLFFLVSVPSVTCLLFIIFVIVITLMIVIRFFPKMFLQFSVFSILVAIAVHFVRLKGIFPVMVIFSCFRAVIIVLNFMLVMVIMSLLGMVFAIRYFYSSRNNFSLPMIVIIFYFGYMVVILMLMVASMFHLLIITWTITFVSFNMVVFYMLPSLPVILTIFFVVFLLFMMQMSLMCTMMVILVFVVFLFHSIGIIMMPMVMTRFALSISATIFFSGGSLFIFLVGIFILFLLGMMMVSMEFAFARCLTLVFLFVERSFSVIIFIVTMGVVFPLFLCSTIIIIFVAFTCMFFIFSLRLLG